ASIPRLCSVLAATARALLQLRSPTSSARRRAPSFPLHCTTRSLPRRATSAIDAPGRRRLAERRKSVGPFSPTPVATPFVFLAGGRTLAPPYVGGRALPLLPRRRSHAKH
ncbi:unnamed protein product, partial [Urochloa humidicola]